MNQSKPCGLEMGCGTSGTAAGAIRSMGCAMMGGGCGAFSGGAGGAGGLVGGVRAAGGAAAWPGGTTSMVGCSGGAGAAVKAVTAVAVGGGGSPAFTLRIFNSCLFIVPPPKLKSAVTMQVVPELRGLRVGT